MIAVNPKLDKRAGLSSPVFLVLIDWQDLRLGSRLMVSVTET